MNAFWPDLQYWIGNNWWKVATILIGAYIVRRFGDTVIAGIVRRTMKRRAHGDLNQDDIKKRQDTVIAMVSAILRVLVWLVAGFSIMRLAFPAIDLTPILASAGVLGVAIGFGAQTLIKDFLSGLFIILENQYRVGDVVEIDKATGTVEQISLRSTVLRDSNGSVHYIPNGTIAHAINKTMGFSKINLTIEVPAATDIDKLAATINEVGTKMASEEKWKKKIMDAPRFLGIDSFTTDNIEVAIIGKTQPAAQWSVTGELRKRLVVALKKQGIIAEAEPESKKP